MRKGAALLAIGIVCAALAGPVTAASAEFCDIGIAYDYSAPFERMPHLRKAPSAFPFAPDGVLLRTVEPEPMLTEAGTVGYKLLYTPFYSTHHFSPRLDWFVLARLSQVDRRGRTTRVLDEASEQIGRMRSSRDRPSGNPLDFTFKVSPEPALYRVEIVIRDSTSGRRLARYGQYTHVLRPRIDVRMSLNGSAFRPQEIVRASLENYGTSTLAFGLNKSIEYFDGVGWVPARWEGMDREAVPAIGIGSGPGSSATCWSFRVRPELTPGLYRFALDVSAYAGPFPVGRSTELTPSAEFQIIPAGQ